MAADDNLSDVQFYHGTSHHFDVGGSVDPAQPHPHNHNASFTNSLYFTEHADEAGAYADMAHSRGGPQAERHVYKIQPTGEYHKDMTQRQGGSYTTTKPVKVVDELD